MAKAFRSDPGQGERVHFMGQIAFIRARAEDTGGLFSVIETRTPKGNGPSPHVHEREDEAFFVLEGELSITVGEETYDAKPGAFVFAPRGVPHAYTATASGKHLTIVTPAGFEHFYNDASEAFIAGPTAVAAVAERYGVTMLGEPSDSGGGR
jgi:quercetin dioxygenase-like cupin family protein